MIRQLLYLFDVGIGDDPISCVSLSHESQIPLKKVALLLPDGEAAQVKRLLDDEPRKLEDV